ESSACSPSIRVTSAAAVSSLISARLAVTWPESAASFARNSTRVMSFPFRGMARFTAGLEKPWPEADVARGSALDGQSEFARLHAHARTRNEGAARRARHRAGE